MKIKKVPCETYSRVVGYYQRIDGFNKGKKEEFKDRVTADMKKLKQKLGYTEDVNVGTTLPNAKK